MSYNHQLTFAIPQAHQILANRVAKSLDPDTGGDASFTLQATNIKTQVHWVLCSTYVTSTFFENLTILINSDKTLYAQIVSDYETRWSGETPPSLAEVTTFLDNLKVVIGGFEQALSELELEKVEQVAETTLV